jgi:RND family efflux transporter MFP subunit
LTSVVSQDPIYAYFDVDEATVIVVRELIRQGKLHSFRESSAQILVSLALGTEQDYPHEGYLDFANNEFTASTATLRLRGVFSNPKPAVGDRLLTPAMFVRVRVPVSPPHSALLIAQGAVANDQDVQFVYVLNEKNEAVRRNVKLGTVHDGLQEIIEGIAAADQVVVSGLQHMHPGVVVSPKLQPMPVPDNKAAEPAPVVMKTPPHSSQKR